MLVTCFNETASLESVALCRPAPLTPTSEQDCRATHFLQPSSYDAMMRNYNALSKKLESFRIKIIDLMDFLQESETKVSNILPNRIFVRDVAAVVGPTLFSGRSRLREIEFSLSQRALERALLTKLDPFTKSDESFEFGDILILNKDAVLVNLGHRGRIKDKSHLMNQLFSRGFNQVAIISLPSCSGLIHLDLACNILNKSTFIGIHSLKFLPVEIYETGVDPIYMTLPDFLHHHGYRLLFIDPLPELVTNFISLDEKTILASHSSSRILQTVTDDYGMTLHSVSIDELEKGGGSIRCLTLPLKRTS